MNAAYKLACQEDTKEVFNASINLVGHCDTGKTSLATRLMGQEFKEDVQSTQGVSIHHLQSTFKDNEGTTGKWSETTLDSSSYLKDFSHAVLTRVKSNKVRKRRGPPNTKITTHVKNDTNSKSGPDAEKSGEENPEQGKILPEKSLEISDPHLNSDEQQNLDANETQKKNRTNKNRSKKLTAANKENTKVGPNQEVGDQHVLNLNEKLMKEILTYKYTLPEQQPDDHSMSICLKDFGGTNELITAHPLFLGTESTTLIVMDITKSLHEILDRNPKLGHPNTSEAVLHYWLYLLHHQASQEHLKPNVAVVLTHRDMIQNDNTELYVQTYINDILNTLQGNPYARLINKDNIYVVDNKSGIEIEFQTLRNKLFPKLRQQRIWGRQMPVRWMKLKADMIEKSQKEEKLMTLANVIGQGKQYGINDKEIESFLRIENILGHFIHYPEPDLREAVIIHPQWIVDKVTTLTTHQKSVETQMLKPKYDHKPGQFTRNNLEELWKERNVEYLIQLMVQLNLIIPIDKSGQIYLIPCMLPQQNSQGEDQAYEDMKIIYSEYHSPKLRNGFFITTFHQLISECSKIKNWKLCTGENPPSYTCASFEMKRGIRLVLRLEKHDSLHVSIWCSKTIFKDKTSELINLCAESRHKLSAKIDQLGIVEAHTFHTLCLNSKPTDIRPCLMELREYQHPTPNKFSYWSIKKKCDLHQGILRETAVPPLLMLASGNNFIKF